MCVSGGELESCGVFDLLLPAEIELAGGALGLDSASAELGLCLAHFLNDRLLGLLDEINEITRRGGDIGGGGIPGQDGGALNRGGGQKDRPENVGNLHVCFSDDWVNTWQSKGIGDQHKSRLEEKESVGRF